MTQHPSDRLIVALDFDRLAPAVRMARRLAGTVGLFKVGSQLFSAEGPAAVRAIAKLGPGVFLDLKFHDIPNTVAGAVRAVAALPGVRLVNVHATGGVEMMQAAAHALSGQRNRPRLLGVTILTSLNARAMRKVGITGTPRARALVLAKLAQRAGLDGVVASAHDVRAIRRACRPRFLIVVPGVRPRGSQANDQSRVATPREAIRAGADYIVVGRPITGALDPRRAAAAIVAEIAAGLAARV